MITKHQPKIFDQQIVASSSSVADGNMKKANLSADQQLEVDNNRKIFLNKAGVNPEQTVLVSMSYDRNDFTRFHEVDKHDAGKGIAGGDVQVADALYTRAKGLALFLPLADCVGAIIYETKKKMLMVSHLGRHNTEQYSARISIEYLIEKFDCDVKDILVWLSPAADCASYPLYAFMNKSLHEVNKQQFINAGILEKNIQVSNIDTAIDENYYSHSQFLKGNREVDGRFAIVAMMK